VPCTGEAQGGPDSACFEHRNVISGTEGDDRGSSLVVMDASIRKEVKQLNLGCVAASILVPPDGSIPRREQSRFAKCY
jgi:hypothetical protein